MKTMQLYVQKDGEFSLFTVESGDTVLLFVDHLSNEQKDYLGGIISRRMPDDATLVMVGGVLGGLMVIKP